MKVFYTGDPRHYQILALGFFLALQMVWNDFGPDFTVVFLTLASVCIVQAVFVYLFQGQSYDLRSPLITGLSLSILLKSSALWLYPLAALLAICSKYCLRQNQYHFFNPANFGIVLCLLLFPNAIWISPGQWGDALWLVAAITGLAALVLSNARQLDMAAFFLGSYAAMTFARAVWLGDPLEIPLNQLTGGAILIFSFFMITDPKTTPRDYPARALFGIAVAALGFLLQYEFQVREGIFYALFGLCAVRYLLARTPKFDKHGLILKRTG